MDALAFPKSKPPPELPKERKRRARSETETLAIIFLQMKKQGLVLKCGCGCGQPVEFGNHRGEHETARKLAAPGENPDRPENQSYWRKDPCSLAKDKRDIRAIAKSRRIRKETKGSRKPKAKIVSRGFQNGKNGPYKSIMGGKAIRRQS